MEEEENCEKAVSENKTNEKVYTEEKKGRMEEDERA